MSLLSAAAWALLVVSLWAVSVRWYHLRPRGLASDDDTDWFAKQLSLVTRQARRRLFNDAIIAAALFTASSLILLLLFSNVPGRNLWVSASAVFRDVAETEPDGSVGHLSIPVLSTGLAALLVWLWTHLIVIGSTRNDWSQFLERIRERKITRDLPTDDSLVPRVCRRLAASTSVGDAFAAIYPGIADGVSLEWIWFRLFRSVVGVDTTVQDPESIRDYQRDLKARARLARVLQDRQLLDPAAVQRFFGVSASGFGVALIVGSCLTFVLAVSGVVAVMNWHEALTASV